MKEKPQKFEEKKETCLFLVQCVAYLQIGENILIKACLARSLEKLANNKKALGFCGLYFKPTFLGKKLVNIFPNVSRIFLFPKIRISVNPKSKRAYQIWCRELSWMTPAIAKVIVDECNSKKLDLEKKSKISWDIMKEEEVYIPILSEVSFILAKTFISLYEKLRGKNAKN